MTNRPNYVAALTDPRFYGVERVDLRARYSAPLDGSVVGRHSLTEWVITGPLVA